MLRRRTNERWMLAGVTIIDPATTYIEPDVTIGQDTTVWPNTHLRGQTIIGEHCTIGPNTIAAMQSGIIFGYAGLVDGIVTRIKEELGDSATVVATGGYADIIAREAKTINVVNPDLTLIGIKTIHDMNRE